MIEHSGRLTPLKQAVATSHKDVAHMKKDTDLDAVRDRDEFKALIKELDKPNPDEPR